jgi:DNA-directed RNA polymerase subunit RPC12/RpoP
MIRFTCPGCQRKLNAKDDLVGQTRNCPNCGTAVLVRPDEDPLVGPEEATPNETAASLIHGVSEEALPLYSGPSRLNRINHYLVCDNSRIVAAWENNGHGWMLRTTAGLISAARNREKIPNQGDFKLVELQMESVEDVLRLRGLTVYQLNRRWGLVGLGRGDDDVLKAVVGLGSLNRDQKGILRMHLNERYMRSVWEDNQPLQDFLGNDDYASPGASM